MADNRCTDREKDAGNRNQGNEDSGEGLPTPEQGGGSTSASQGRDQSANPNPATSQTSAGGCNGVPDEYYDIIIVGAGVAGAYCAWRLANLEKGEADKLKDCTLKVGSRQEPISIALFEGSNRIGGRLMSVRISDMNNRCELGGMRYSRQKHPLVRWLVEDELGLHSRPLPVDQPENLAYLRGRHLRRRDLTDRERLPYMLDWAERDSGTAERDRSPDELLDWAFKRIVPEIDNWRRDPDKLWRKLRDAKYYGEGLYNWGMWRLLAQVMSPEAFRLARDAGGYDTSTRNWNALSSIVDSYQFRPVQPGEKLDFRAVKEGFQQVPKNLVDEVESPERQGKRKVKARVHRNMRLISFKSIENSECIRACFRKTSDGSDIAVKTRRLILAMPRRSLELVNAGMKETQDRIKPKKLRSVTPIPLFKAFLCYDQAWWKATGVTIGRSVTDMPIRQCYYWEERQGKGTLMVYDDDRMADFWYGQRDPTQDSNADSKDWLIDPPKCKKDWLNEESEEWKPKKLGDSSTIWKHTAELMQKQLAIMHGLREIPPPTHFVCFDWRREPFGGGVNFWNVGEKLWECIPDMLQPKGDKIHVYICGEAYSATQGWVEGALETAEAVLQRHLGIEAPTIKDEKYELPAIYGDGQRQR